jgi:hypothetical protein
MMDLRRLAPLALLIPAVAAGATLKPRWPKDQQIHYELGAAAPRVEELDVRWATDDASGGGARSTDADWAREVGFRYAPGQAPRTVSHSPRLADGAYSVEIEIRASGRAAVVHRHVLLEGGTTTLDLASVVP